MRPINWKKCRDEPKKYKVYHGKQFISETTAASEDAACRNIWWIHYKHRDQMTITSVRPYDLKAELIEE